MNKIITFLTNDNNIIQQANNRQPPLNSFAVLTDDYDFIDMNGNRLQLRDNNKIAFCRKAIEITHVENIQKITAEMTRYKTLIADLELLSQKASPEEYEKISEDVNKYIEQLEKLNDEIERLNAQFESKKNAFLYERSRSPPPRRDRSSSPPIRARRPAQNACTSSALISDTGYKVSNVNGWDENAIETVRNWRILFKENKYIYEWVLEKNHRISTNLNLISVVSSSAMGCFSAFKLWVQDDRVFQATSDIIMLFSNFLIAAITTSSKRYIDDNRNEKIRNYLEEVSRFLGNITSELIKTAEYRMNADKFIRTQQEIYSKLIINKPSISISELTAAKNAYRDFEKSFMNVETQETQTETDSSKETQTDSFDIAYQV
jgi:phage host-nuclease inhibitor protein Gam